MALAPRSLLKTKFLCFEGKPANICAGGFFIVAIMSVNKRIFLAIEVSDEWKIAIREFIEANRQTGYRWIAEENWHFTVLFIGDFPAGKLNSIYPLLQKCFAQIPAFYIDFDTFMYFPPNRPRMIWVNGKPSREFTHVETSAYKTLKHFYSDAYMEMNAKPSQKSIPHITLSRLKFSPKPLLQLHHTNPVLPVNAVKEIVLFESQLKPTGSLYTSLKKFTLKPLFSKH